MPAPAYRTGRYRPGRFPGAHSKDMLCMRIIIANDTYYPNVDGCSYFSQRLAHYLKKRGHSILVIAPSRTRHTEYFSHDGIDIFGLYSLPTLFHKAYRFSPPFFIKKKISAAIQTFRPDVIHVQGHFYIENAVVDVARELRIPVMGTNHFMPENLSHYAHAPKIVEAWIIKLMWSGFRSVFEKLEVVTAPTKTAARILHDIGLNKKVIPISCGVDLQKYNPQAGAPRGRSIGLASLRLGLNNGDYLRKRYHLPNKPLLLCVGRLAPEKNIDCILRAVAAIAAAVSKKIPIHLVVAGGGLERKNLEKLAARLDIADSVTFTGFVPDEDMPNLYAISTAFAVAGTVELQSLVTMEAMASGLPVVAANALALPELVHHGENGYLFSPNDVAGIAEYFSRIFSDHALAKRMGQKSLQIAKAHDINITIASFEKIYESLRQETC